MMFWLGTLLGFTVGAIVSAAVVIYLIMPSTEDLEQYLSDEQDKFIQKVMKETRG
jgi:hypothetical protein